MSYVGYGQSPYLQEPKVRIEAIGEAWGYVREKMAVWAISSLIYGIVFTIGIVLIELVLTATGLSAPIGTRNPSFSPLYLVGNVISTILLLALNGFLQGGLIRMALKQIRGEEIAIGDMFSVGESAGSAIVAHIIHGLGTNLGTILCIIPGIFISTRGVLSLPIAVDQNPGGWQAFNKSWEALKTQTSNAFLLLFVLGLLLMLGILALGIGALFTGPLYPLTLAIVYRDFFNTERGMAQPTLNVPLPPQSAYGSGRFGDTPNPPAPGRFGDMPSRPLGQNPPPPPTPPAPPGEMPRL